MEKRFFAAAEELEKKIVVTHEANTAHAHAVPERSPLPKYRREYPDGTSATSADLDAAVNSALDGLGQAEDSPTWEKITPRNDYQVHPYMRRGKDNRKTISSGEKERMDRGSIRESIGKL